MTCGIYKLNFIGTDKVYIGQSINIERRFAQHLDSLLKKYATLKMTTAYIKFGLPELEIIESGSYSKEELDLLENNYIKLWNSVDYGFNSLYHAGDVPYTCGEDKGNAKFTNEQIKQVFFILINTPALMAKDISELTGVSIGIIRQVATCSIHLWLKREFPTEYSKLENLQGTRNCAKGKGIVYPTLVDPLGNTYNVENVNKFAREHELNSSNLGQVLKGKRKSCGGWRLYE